MSKLEEAVTKKYRQEAENRKKIEEYVSTMISKYAETNGFKIIVNVNYGSENILYNANKIVLNVNDDVIAFIAKEADAESNKNSSVSK